MRRDPKSGGGEETGTDGRLVRRSGLLRESEQRSGRNAASIEFLIAFVRHLIRENPSSDALYLAMRAAAKEVGITQEQAQLFRAAIMMEQRKAPWPKGFFA